MSTTNQSDHPHHEGKKYIEFKPADGEKLMKIKPSDLSIVWGKDNRYWNVPDDDTAELYQVSWLEVTGCVSNTVPEKEYEVGFRVSFAPDAFGWIGLPVYILVKRGKSGKFKAQRCPMDSSSKEEQDIKAKATKLEIDEGNKNLEDDGDGEGEGEDNSKIYFGLYEVWRGKWKGGLKIHHAFLQQI